MIARGEVDDDRDHDAEAFYWAWSEAVDREIELADAPEWEEVPA